MLRSNHLSGFGAKKPPPTLPPGTSYITWAGKTNVTETAGSALTKSSGSEGSWDAGAYSVQSVASGQIKVEATILFATHDQGIIGISNVTDAQANVDFTNIDFAIFVFNDGNLYTAVNGSVVFLVAYAVNDIISIDVDGAGHVNFRKNGTIITTNSSPTLNYPLCADCSFEHIGFGLAECKITV